MLNQTAIKTDALWKSCCHLGRRSRVIPTLKTL